jgi:hypothetical protein
MIALAAIEWTWGEALLNESWRDGCTIAGFTLTINRIFGYALADS